MVEINNTSVGETIYKSNDTNTKRQVHPILEDTFRVVISNPLKPRTAFLKGSFEIIGTSYIMLGVLSNASEPVTLPNPRTLQITSLPNKELKKPILITLETDESGYISRSVDFPLYGYSDSPDLAIESLKHEIESLYDDLMEDDNFSQEWLKYKNLLKEFIAERK